MRAHEEGGWSLLRAPVYILHRQPEPVAMTLDVRREVHYAHISLRRILWRKWVNFKSGIGLGGAEEEHKARFSSLQGHLRVSVSRELKG